eukprot:5495975-Prymnesium_polylepis.1
MQNRRSVGLRGTSSRTCCVIPQRRRTVGRVLVVLVARRLGVLARLLHVSEHVLRRAEDRARVEVVSAVRRHEVVPPRHAHHRVPVQPRARRPRVLDPKDDPTAARRRRREASLLGRQRADVVVLGEHLLAAHRDERVVPIEHQHQLVRIALARALHHERVGPYEALPLLAEPDHLEAEALRRGRCAQRREVGRLLRREREHQHGRLRARH